VRAIAMRGGVVVATGADRTFVAGAETPPQTGRNGGGDNAGIGSDDAGAGPGESPPAPPVPDPPFPPQIFTVPKATMKGMAKSVRLDRKGRLVLSFRATPAAARSSLKVAFGKVSGGSARFTVPTNGRVKVIIKASAKLRAALRKKSSVKAKATIKLGITTFTATLTIKPYKKPAKKRA
jgi:hypothetical protein